MRKYELIRFELTLSEAIFCGWVLIVALLAHWPLLAEHARLKVRPALPSRGLLPFYPDVIVTKAAICTVYLRATVFKSLETSVARETLPSPTCNDA